MKKTNRITLVSLAQADDGDLSSEFDACLALIEQDIRSRSDVKQSRRLALTLIVKPNSDGTALMEVNVVTHLPKRGPEVRTIKLTQEGMEMGNDPKNPDQKTIFDDEPEETTTLSNWRSKRDEAMNATAPKAGAKRRSSAPRKRKGSK